MVEFYRIMEQVILVDDKDKLVGVGEKLKTHEEGRLHRAFSIFIFNDNRETLLQRRALTKYHSGGLWSNTCCGHPRPGEDLIAAALRRLNEEMGINTLLKRDRPPKAGGPSGGPKDQPLSEAFSFHYQAKLDHGLFENEIDHVLFGRFNGEPRLNPAEAMAFRWISLKDLRAEVKMNPQVYTYWLKMIMANSRWRLIQ